MNIHPASASFANNIKQKSFIFNIASCCGASVHLVFIFLFVYIEQDFLAWFNIASVLLWLSTLYFNKCQQHAISASIMCGEIIAHAFLATKLLGADAGFQYYLWPMALLIVAVPVLPTVSSALLGITNMIAFGVFSVLFSQPIPGLAPHYFGLYIFNTIFASVPFIIIAAIARCLFENQFLKISQLAEHDELTKLYNRRFAQRLLQYYFSRARCGTKTFCIALVDVDNFKKINDELGHDMGDEALIKISHYLSNSLREKDICCRWGGEEFLFVFPNTQIEMIHKRLEEICQKMPKDVNIDQWHTPISCSFGLIQVQEEETLKEAFKRVDCLLYQAKNNGRYQVASDHIQDSTRCEEALI
ncbi:GGDEF domain-containing protein [Marinomonas pollencensis]|nr:GGDEF domain-containing protein [Marinomonas pollencensis]